MGRVPITIMGYRCEQCGHEWLPDDTNQEPQVCPKCKSLDWDKPDNKGPMPYEEFRDRVRTTIESSEAPLTWTEIRTRAKLPQAFPNNQWVHRMEKDTGLMRERDKDGIIRWRID